MSDTEFMVMASSILFALFIVALVAGSLLSGSQSALVDALR
jgi:hypothetical protein